MTRTLNRRVSPSLDGIDHINIHSNGRSELGRLLCDQAQTPFTHPRYGKFESLEGYRHWCRTGKQHHILKELWGVAVGHRSRKYKEQRSDNYANEIVEGIHCKVMQTPDLYELLMGSVLPLECYFVFDTSLRPHRHGPALIKELIKIRNGKPLMSFEITDGE